MADAVSTPQEIETELRKVLSYLTGNADLIHADANKPFKELGIDSMMAIEIMAALEKELKIQLQERDLAKFTSIKETVETLLTYVR
ncbi:acyl carrier protein [Candidatus Uhrbacteria bacterium]|nr:acyl carrier protein [Candidatus Uhrbacteria bacterium]